MTEIPRDRWGKPLITPPGGSRPVAYDRVSSYGDALDDKTGLERWKRRETIKGLIARPDLLLQASASADNKYVLDRIAEEALEAAGGSAAANTGTALHGLTEILDRGQPLPPFPEKYAADLDAYQVATARFDHAYIEQFVVCDELQAAGTPDRLSYEANLIGDHRLVVCDVKTNKDNRYLDKYAVQLAIYAHSDLYDVDTGMRTPIDLDQEVAYIFHMPAGQGKCDIYEIDIAAGWEKAQLAHEVRRHRKNRAALKRVDAA